ncbi:TadE family protein [Streptomyces sp. NBRC 109706]|uniref:TadE family protein n=1 Tax=Streptomyces sp. NBRC 109706 TaxID=1550035 RepID=UPI000782ED6D|nr:TadE family protein [Streptomyces sp. NBRC 109706]
MNPRRDDGSASLELVLLTPVLILLTMLVVGLGRVADVRIRVEDAAHHAARAASLAYDTERAQHAAHQAAGAALAGCAQHFVNLDHDGLLPGSTVTATVSCRSDLTDLVGTGLPGALTLTATSTSPVDTYRSTE